MMKNALLAGAIALPLFLQTQNAFGAIAIFYDRAAFEAAAGLIEVEDFSSFDSDVSYSGSPVDVGGFVLSSIGDQSYPANLKIESNGFYANSSSTSVGSDQYIQLHMKGTDGGESVLFSFDSPITAFGADFFSINDNEDRTRINVGGDSFIPTQTARDLDRFIGFISDTPFDVVEFESITVDLTKVDNVTYSIPEPSVMGLIAAGSCVLAGRRKRLT